MSNSQKTNLNFTKHIMTNQQLQAENERLKHDIDLMRTIASADGFYNYFFKISLNFKTREDAFDHVNELFYKLFRYYRYLNYDSFRRTKRKK